MEQAKVIAFLQKNKHLLFEKESTDQKIIGEMLKLKDEYLPILERISLRNPTTVQLISVFAGIIGIDRFYLGDIKKGLLKYFTFGCFGILWIKDIKSAKRRCREYNCKKLLKAINDPSAAKEMISNEDNLKKIATVAVAVTPALVKGFKDVQKSMEVH